MIRKISRRSRTRLLVAGSVAGAVALAGGVIGVASAATARPQLSLLVPTKKVTVERYVDEDSGQGFVYLDLNTNVVAGDSPFEIRVSRKSYQAPIVATQIVQKKGKKTKVKLPSWMVADFGGLRDFGHVTIKDGAGKTVRSFTTDFCPNGYDSTRTRRDAPSTTPYPIKCEYNPFIIGSVWGVQTGYNSQLATTPPYRPGKPFPEFDLALGTYKTEVSIDKRYRDYFKIPAKSASVTLDMTVVPYVDQGGPGQGIAPPQSAFAATSRAAGVAVPGATDEHGQHASEGDPSRQVSAFAKDLRPATKRPAALAAAAAPKGPRPDLRVLPAWNIELGPGRTDDGEPATDGKSYLSFAATVWNGGTSTLVVDGFRRTGTELMDAYQYFYDAKGKQVGSVKAGAMQWDKREGHNHWHFKDFAQYRLLKADKKVAVISGKEAFCLANTDGVDLTIPNAKWRPSNTDLSTSCGQNTSVAVRQVLDVGNGDTYTQGLPGQSFDVTDLPNGTYYVEVLANPSKKLTELSTANNSALRKVILSGSKTNRKVTVPPVHGIEG